MDNQKKINLIIEEHLTKNYEVSNTNISKIIYYYYNAFNLVIEGDNLRTKLYKEVYIWNDIIYKRISLGGFLKIDMDYTMWTSISLFQSLDIDFIDKYKDYLNWEMICKYQNLTEFMLKKFIKYIKWDYIAHNKIINDDIKIKYYNKSLIY